MLHRIDTNRCQLAVTSVDMFMMAAMHYSLTVALLSIWIISDSSCKDIDTNGIGWFTYTQYHYYVYIHNTLHTSQL